MASIPITSLPEAGKVNATDQLIVQGSSSTQRATVKQVVASTVDKTFTEEDQPASAKLTKDELKKKLGTTEKAADSSKWAGMSFLNENAPTAQNVLVLADGNVKYVALSYIANFNGVSASGNGYIRFTDGTQICWGDTSKLPAVSSGTLAECTATFAQAFADTNYAVVVSPAVDVGNSWTMRVSSTVKSTTSTKVVVGSASHDVGSGNNFRYIAIGRWK